MAATTNNGQTGQEQVSVRVSEDLPTIKGNIIPAFNGLTLEDIGVIANKMMVHLYGLNKPTVEAVIGWIENSINNNYFLSNPKDLRNS